MFYTCEHCGKHFDEKKSKRRYSRKFCSTNCFHVHVKKPDIKCEWCGKTFSSRRRVSKFGPIRFCSRSCSNQATNKKRREMRVFNSGGYVRVCAPEHPRAYGGRVREHTLVVEKMLGRYLDSSEEVHHVNRMRDDNRPENLVVCENHQEHSFLEKVSRFLETEFIRDKNLTLEFTAYVMEKFMNSYRRGDYKKYIGKTAKNAFESMFGKTDDKGKLRRFLFIRLGDES